MTPDASSGGERPADGDRPAGDGGPAGSPGPSGGHAPAGDGGPAGRSGPPGGHGPAGRNRPVRRSFRCAIGWHHFVDFPDPNPESGGLEKQGYRACIRCPKEKDSNVYTPRQWYGWKWSR